MESLPSLTLIIRSILSSSLIVISLALRSPETTRRQTLFTQFTIITTALITIVVTLSKNGVIQGAPAKFLKAISKLEVLGYTAKIIGESEGKAFYGTLKVIAKCFYGLFLYLL